MRQVAGEQTVDAEAVSENQMGADRDREAWATAVNRTALANLSGQWIDRFHERKPSK